MTFLPIVERELRVAARRPATYWTRSAMGLGSILIGVLVFVFCFGLPAQQTTQFIFQGLAWLLMLYCLLLGRATTDCLSREKREGTLGLLFLTNLKGHDVVLGKLAATSLGSFYALLAAVPVLAVPLLMGGVSSGEFWRMVLTLIDTSLFCLVVGVFSSALCREHRQAAALNLNLLLLLAAVPPAARFVLLYFHLAGGLLSQFLCGSARSASSGPVGADSGAGGATGMRANRLPSAAASSTSTHFTG
jgi:ABC-type transport system involved in cytochrome c biogenesis permease component